VRQYVSFNSPVWFNIGVPDVAQQASACFILDVEDDLRSILNWYAEEGMIFKGGSGAGANLSKIRSSKEQLSGGGTPSGPVSFMRGADASAGTIKSGGTTRRAAKMVILDVDHPDIDEFIWCKAREERKARVLRDAGFDMDLDGADSASVQYQNANNSVRLSDEFIGRDRRRGLGADRTVRRARGRTPSRPPAAARHRGGVLGVCRPRRAVRHHHQPLEHHSLGRPDRGK
jgi:ribonucleoside-diphosphate reductase alpha chain